MGKMRVMYTSDLDHIGLITDRPWNSLQQIQMHLDDASGIIPGMVWRQITNTKVAQSNREHQHIHT
jgi:hypothetical protein